jgi:hypothetical protein
VADREVGGNTSRDVDWLPWCLATAPFVSPPAAAFAWLRASRALRAGRPEWTSTKCADQACLDACFDLAEQASEETGPARLVLVQARSVACSR